MVIITYIHHSLIEMAHQQHFIALADIGVLDKSVILGLPFCVFVGYNVLTYANDSLTYWLPDRIKTIDWLWKAFS